jgi:hypothetical protein
MSDNASPKPGPSRPPLSKAIATGKASLGSVCSSTCTATVQRTSLLAERKGLASGKATDDDGEVADAALAHKVIAFIDAKLANLASEQAVLANHCTATPEQIRAATTAYQQEIKNAALAVLGRMMHLGGLKKQLRKAEANVRRMQSG